MSKNVIVTLSVVAGIIILWLLLENKNKDWKIESLQKEIDENNNLNKEIKKMLKELIENNKEIDPDIANELSKISALIEIKQDSKAILSLVKIIETLLYKIYQADVRLKSIASKNGRSRPAFMDYLELALNDKSISKEEYHLISVAKIVRDEEAHQVDVEKEKTRILSSFIAAIGIILTLCRIVKKQIGIKVNVEEIISAD